MTALGIHSFPEVAGRIVIKYYSTLAALRLLMLLEADVLDFHLGTLGVTAEVEEQGDGFHIDTVHVGHLVHERFSGLDVMPVCKVEGIVIPFLHQLDGDTRDVHGGREGAAEVIFLLGRRAHVGVEGHLALPLAVRCFRHGEVVDKVLVIGLESGVRKAFPTTAVSRIEAHGIGHAAPEVGGTGDVVMSTLLNRYIRFLAGKNGTVVDGVVLQSDAGNGHFRVGCVSAKVEDHLHAVGGIDTLEVGEIVDGFAGREFLALGEQEIAVVTHIGELEGEARKLVVGSHNHREVIVLVGREYHGSGRVDEELGLPLVGGGFGQRQGVFGTVLHGFRIVNLGPTGGIPEAEGMILVGRLPEVAVGIVVEAGELDGTFLGSEDKVPGDFAVIVHQYQTGRFGLQHFEARGRPESVIVDVGEQRVLGKHQIQIIPLHCEGIGAGLGIHRCIVVGSGITLLIHERRYGNADVYISGAIITRIIDIAVVGAEAHFVFVQAEGILVSRSGAIPFQTLCTGRSATQVFLDGSVDMPGTRSAFFLSTSQHVDVLGEIHESIVDVEGLFHIVGGYARRIHHVHPNFVVAGGGKDAGKVIPGITVRKIFRFAVVEKPNGNNALGIDGEGNLIGLLVHGNNGLIN